METGKELDDVLTFRIMKSSDRPLSPHLQIYKPQITSGLSDQLTGFIKSGLASRAQQIINMFPPNLYLLALRLAIAMQESVIGIAMSLFDSLECVGDKVNQAMKGVIDDMLVGLVKNAKFKTRGEI